MTVLAALLRIVSAGLSLYMLACVARIVMTWFPGGLGGQGAAFLERLTEPYLAFFRRFAFLRGGAMDFSPIAALAVLAALSRALTVASYGALTLGFVLALILETAWSPVAFLLSFMAVLALARIVAYQLRWNSLHPAWRVVDAMVNPVLFKIKALIYKDRIVNYMQGLITGFLVLAAIRLLGGLAVRALSALLLRF